jgi:hypothetical protein
MEKWSWIIHWTQINHKSSCKIGIVKWQWTSDEMRKWGQPLKSGKKQIIPYNYQKEIELLAPSFSLVKLILDLWFWKL